MEYKKSRWENEYDNYKANKDELKTKMATIRREQAALKEGPDYAAKKAELEELKKTATKYARIEKNSSKIENILSFKKELVGKTADLLTQKNEIEKLDTSKTKLESAIKKLDDDRQKSVDRIKKIEEELKNPQLKEEDKQKLQREKQEKLKNIQENDVKFQEVANTRDAVVSKIEQYDKDKINKEILKNEQLLGKCDLIGANLVKGRSMEEISTSLQNFKFTPNKDFAKKIQAMRDMYGKDKEQTGEENKEESKDKGIVDDKNNDNEADLTEEIEKGVQRAIEEENRKDAEENKPAKVSEFDQKHPRLAKVKNFFKNAWTTIKDKITRESKEAGSEMQKSETTKAEKQEQETKEPEIKNSDFEYAMKHLDGQDQDEVLKTIAEKGTAGFRESIKVEKQQKYKEMKDAAAIDYAMRYGRTKEGKATRYLEQDGINQDDDGSR